MEKETEVEKTVIKPDGVKSDIVRWSNSSNVLCNFMKEPVFLEMILDNRAIIPRYVIEPLDYLKLSFRNKIAFPMTCFCDIPFGKVGKHISKYGGYGIAFEKAIVIDKYGIQPIHYIQHNSPLANDFKEVFNKYGDAAIIIPEEYRSLLNYLLSSLVYMKPIQGTEIEDDRSHKYIFQDECEWRYIPSKMPQDIPFILKKSDTTEKGKSVYSTVLQSHRETWLNFEWDEVKYIIVPDKSSCGRIVNHICNMELDEHERNMLLTKIEISQNFGEDLI